MNYLDRYRKWLRRRIPTVLLRALAASSLLPLPAYAADGVAETSVQTGIGIAVLTGLLAAFGFISLVLPHRLLDFWVKSLMSSGNVAEQCAAANELRRIKDPRALLALLDVTDDDESSVRARNAAGKAMSEMISYYPKQRQTILELKSAIEMRNPQGVIDILAAKFETSGKKYTQSAYVIGRQYMKLEQFADARDWLKTAKARDRASLLHDKRIIRFIKTCNDKLVAEGDRLFEASHYHYARAQYALISQGLDNSDKRRFAIYLRSACAYCKLNNYLEAQQAVLHALRSDQETSRSLTLITLLHKLVDRTDEERDKVQEDIDECVSDIMIRLTARKYEAVEPSALPEKTETSSWMHPQLVFPRIHAS